MAHAILGQLARAFHYTGRHIFVGLYSQHLKPHLELAAAAWSPWQEAAKECQRECKRELWLWYQASMQEIMRIGCEAGHGDSIVYVEEGGHQNDTVQVYKMLTGKDQVQRESI